MAFLPCINRLIMTLLLIFLIPNTSAVAVINITQLTYGTNTSYVTPSWSPNGYKIAYTFGSGDSYNIWIMNSDGSNIRQITDNPGNHKCFQWPF